jgi:hypothetical protein
VQRIRISIITVFASSLLIPSHAQAWQLQVGQWRNHTDMKSIRSVLQSTGQVVCASGGGMFVYDEATKHYDRFTVSEGLTSNDLTSVAMDTQGRLWFGASNGAVDVFDPSSRTWQAVPDIKESNRSQKSIRGFFATGDSVFIVSDFGVAVFNTSKWEFGDTYASFGFAIQPAVTKAIIRKNDVWVGTDRGIASASLGSPNLSAPTSWTLYGAAQGLTSANITSLAVFRDTILAGTPGGVYFLAGNTFQLIASTVGKSIVDIEISLNRICFVWNGTNQFTVESQNYVLAPSLVIASKNGIMGTSLSFSAEGMAPYVGTTTLGVVHWNGTSWDMIAPNGPQSNLFVSLCVDASGVLWGASGINGGGRGFYRFDPALMDGDQWKNFTKSDYPVLLSDDYYKVSTTSNGSVWISSWGDGVVEVVADTIRRRLSAISKPSLSPTVPQDARFVVVGGVGQSPDGGRWLVNRTAVSGNYVVKFANDTTFEYFRNLYNTSDGIFSSIAVDQNGTKWLANSEPSIKVASGLYYFNEDKSVSGTEQTGGWGNMNVTDGLPNNTVLALAVDQENDIWIGTDLGATIITDGRNPKTRRTSVFPLREQSIQTIAIDALNNKWVGTKEGVFVVSPDGAQLLAQYNTLNTNGKLVDNDVRSICIDQKRGMVYFGTEKGLSSLQIEAVQTVRTFAGIDLGPNPFVLPSSQPMRINNLVANSTIKILSVSGALVLQFRTQGGGRAFWDGRDQRGSFVSTGIYYVVAYAENGNQVANGKVAVVRQ